jgi:uncharacterized protein with PIN domain
MKEQIVTFKVDNELMTLLKRIPNKSEFIRQSILKALDNVCPLCNGTGILKETQKAHWEEFKVHHQIKKCEQCNELYLSCDSM